MKVCIAEKPSVAKDIAKVIGANQRHDGYYEGNGYQVTWTFGHLCTLKEPHDYLSEWKYWDLRQLPMIPSRFGIKLIEDDGIKRQFHIAKKLLNNATEVINCGDAGQEGEVIQRWVFLKAQVKAPIKRLWISSLTEEAIKEGFANLKEGSKYNNLYAAGSSRAIGDWLLGINATRLFTKKFGFNRQVLSIGRVQTPTLAMIVERQLEIDNFIPEDYWELRTIYRDTEFNSVLGKIKKKEKAEYALEKIKDEPFEITSFEQKEGKEKPPKLFDLTALQVEANKKLSYSADQTLKIVQKLYEKKLVTYPRVDTTYLPNDIYPKISGILERLEYFKELTQPLLGKKIRKSSQVFDDKKVTDHHAIIPTGERVSGVTPDEQKVYNMITKRFISVFYPDCIVSRTTVLGEVLKLEFKASGKQILEPGWRVIYTKDENPSDEKEDESIMPVFQQGEKGPHDARIDEKQTTPPKPYTEATLLRAMETAGKQVDDEEMRELMKDNGIGRPSTRANIIETLFRRRYITKRRKSIYATETGIDLIKIIDNDILKSPELTGTWEKKLHLIEKGEYEPELFKKELIEMVVELTNEVLFNTKKKAIRIAPENEDSSVKTTTKKSKVKKIKLSELDCPKCKKNGLLKGKKAYGCSHYKDGCNFVLPFEFLGKKLTDKQLSDIILKQKTTKIKGFIIPGSENKKDGRLVLTSDFNISLEE
ncbi:MAG: DNA topoisomerase 3 [Brumimicrobium sp.]